MCSVSFLPQTGGFAVLMNRDEQVSRAAALPPSLRRRGRYDAIYPCQFDGGAWIGINEAGLTLALINWYSPKLSPGRLSRGIVIPALLAAGTAGDAHQLLTALPLSLLSPFRLIAICAKDKSLEEWRCHGTDLKGFVLPWKKRHWFSSGYDEEKADQIRTATCCEACTQEDRDTVPWLRRLHRSHAPVRGPFSLCMHRADAGTVSCTEILVDLRGAVMTYHDGPPCQPGPESTHSLALDFGNSRVAA